MVENMREALRMTKGMDMVFIHGLTAGNMKDPGCMGNNMDKESIFFLMVSIELVFGKMEPELAGSITRTILLSVIVMLSVLETLDKEILKTLLLIIRPPLVIGKTDPSKEVLITNKEVSVISKGDSITQVQIKQGRRQCKILKQEVSINQEDTAILSKELALASIRILEDLISILMQIGQEIQACKEVQLISEVTLVLNPE
jgi:hypothetical protein